MFIHEAILNTSEKKPYISRENEEWQEAAIKIWPTNTAECCVIMSQVSRSMRGWEPSKDDLLANDWVSTN